MQLIIPEMKPIPKNASMKIRKKMYNEHVAELKRLNPWYVPGNAKKSFWNLLKRIFV